MYRIVSSVKKGSTAIQLVAGNKLQNIWFTFENNSLLEGAYMTSDVWRKEKTKWASRSSIGKYLINLTSFAPWAMERGEWAFSWGND